jgi:hypothetical protein
MIRVFSDTERTALLACLEDESAYLPAQNFHSGGKEVETEHGTILLAV